MLERMRQYARLLIRVGVNIQKGQNLVLLCPVECAQFGRMCATEAYAAGCREVIVSWRDDYMTREKYLKAADDVFDSYPAWLAAFYNDNASEGAAFLAISASDPENLKGVDPGRLQRAEVSSGAAVQTYRRLQMSNGFPWCIASVPVDSWAQKVFPGADKQAAVERLWDAICAAVRVDGGDPVKNWEEHLASLGARKKKLNEYRFRSLHYTNSLGTDLTIELPKTHFWQAGGDRTHGGQVFIANMPTEEIFTAPKRDGVNGVAVASMPLVKDGNVIDGFRMRFENGKIVEVQAEQGEDVLRSAIAVDEGASYLGEVALVPYDSPISNAGVLFYNTLFDENASCHLAFGEASPCIDGGMEMDKRELAEHGLNDSITHVDFMIGTPDLSIVGTTWDGEQIPVFTNGNFAF